MSMYFNGSLEVSVVEAADLRPTEFATRHQILLSNLNASTSSVAAGGAGTSGTTDSPMSPALSTSSPFAQQLSVQSASSVSGGATLSTTPSVSSAISGSSPIAAGGAGVTPTVSTAVSTTGSAASKAIRPIDAYALIDLDEWHTVLKTSVVAKSNNPRWNPQQESVYIADVQNAQSIGVTVFHDCAIPPDDFVANCILPLDELMGQEYHDIWVSNTSCLSAFSCFQSTLVQRKTICMQYSWNSNHTAEFISLSSCMDLIRRSRCR